MLGRQQQPPVVLYQVTASQYAVTSLMRHTDEIKLQFILKDDKRPDLTLISNIFSAPFWEIINISVSVRLATRQLLMIKPLLHVFILSH